MHVAVRGDRGSARQVCGLLHRSPGTVSPLPAKQREVDLRPRWQWIRWQVVIKRASTPDSAREPF